MADLFDGLADILSDPNAGFGEPVVYTPLATGIPLGSDGTINAIWCEDHEQGQFEVKSDQSSVRAEVKISDVPEPKEGDTVRRKKTGYFGKVVPPIVPDGHGFVSVTLQKIP